MLLLQKEGFCVADLWCDSTPFALLHAWGKMHQWYAYLTGRRSKRLDSDNIRAAGKKPNDYIKHSHPYNDPRKAALFQRWPQ